MTPSFLISPGDRASHGVAFQQFSAQYWRHGYFVKEDWRYDAMYCFAHASPSFQAALAHVKGKPSALPLPKDLAKVLEVVEDFFVPLGPKTPQTNESIARMQKLGDSRKRGVERLARSTDWWDANGKRLFGLAAPDPSVRIFGPLTESNRTFRVERHKNDSVVAQISLGQSLDEALEQLKATLQKFNFSTDNVQVDKPKYKLYESAIRRSSAAMALEVLRLYCYGAKQYPLWTIGNQCAVTKSVSFTAEQYEKLTPKELAYRKKRLEIATSRVLRTALLLAENAARGRFPSIEPFEEAQLKAFKRDTGRPAGSKTRKAREIPAHTKTDAPNKADLASLSAAFGSSLPSGMNLKNGNPKK